MPLLTEDNYIDWFLQGASRQYALRGFHVSTFSVGQRAEIHSGVDRFLHIGDKIVGLQFKAPQGGPPWWYHFDREQHETLSTVGWVQYCLPEFGDPALQFTALDYVRIAAPYAVDVGSGMARHGKNWRSFSAGVEECRLGKRIGDQAAFHEVARQIREEPAQAMIVIDRLENEVRLLDGR